MSIMQSIVIPTCKSENLIPCLESDSSAMGVALERLLVVGSSTPGGIAASN